MGFGFEPFGRNKSMPVRRIRGHDDFFLKRQEKKRAGRPRSLGKARPGFPSPIAVVWIGLLCWRI